MVRKSREVGKKPIMTMGVWMSGWMDGWIDKEKEESLTDLLVRDQ